MPDALSFSILTSVTVPRGRENVLGTTTQRKIGAFRPDRCAPSTTEISAPMRLEVGPERRTCSIASFNILVQVADVKRPDLGFAFAGCCHLLLHNKRRWGTAVALAGRLNHLHMATTLSSSTAGQA